MIYWIYLLIASVVEICWLYSIKSLSLKDIKAIEWNTFFDSTEPFMTLAPLLGYIVFGLGNVTLFSMAMKGIPASTAFGIWMALALVGAKIIDVAYFDEPFSYRQLFFMGMILVGIVGLKVEEMP